MRKILCGIVLLSPPFLKKLILKWFCGAKIGRKARIGWFAAVMGRHVEMGDYSEVRSFSVVWCDAGVRIGKYSVVSYFTLIYGPAGLVIGDRSHVGPQCLINTWEDVRIGSASALGPRCMLFTHTSFLPYTDGYMIKCAPVAIGDRVWIGAGAFIYPGLTIGDDVFVNAMCVLARDVPTGEAVDGFPAKRVAFTSKLKRSMTPNRVDTAARHILNHFADVILKRGMGLQVNEDTPTRLSFRYGGREYVLLCIRSDGSPSPDEYMQPSKRFIFLVNRENWVPPPAIGNPIVFDLAAMRASLSRDRVYTALSRFMKDYYGMKFEYH